METIALKKIQADANQPRKYFAADKMRSLTESIKREGIITPLVVEKVGDGYLLIDGERRFRAATELGLKEVPVVIEATRSATERAVRQFTIQEMHEAWTPLEKAVALTGLSDKLGLKLEDVCKLLNINRHSTEQYISFSRLADKENFIRNEVPIDFARGLASVTNSAKKAYAKQDKEFSKTDQKRLEKRIIVGIKDGSIEARKDVSKLSFAFTKNPKMIEKYISDAKLTPQGVYLDSGAQGARALSNMNFSVNYVLSNMAIFMKHQDVEVSPYIVSSVKRMIAESEKFVRAFDK